MNYTKTEKHGAVIYFGKTCSIKNPFHSAAYKMVCCLKAGNESGREGRNRREGKMFFEITIKHLHEKGNFC